MSDSIPLSEGNGSAPQDGTPQPLSSPPTESSKKSSSPQGDPGQAQPDADHADTGEVQSPQAELPTGQAVVARYGVLRSLGLFRHELSEPLRAGTKVVVRSERGLELAEVVTNVAEECRLDCIHREQLTNYLHGAGPEYPFYRNGRVLRLANAQDLIDQRHLTGSAHEEAQFCRKQIRDLKLNMKLVTVEHLLGGERIIFYFSAENRVDFRELVRRLASQFRTRIEMRQVGARDEARLVGDFERCGRPCCCQSFLKDLKPISMRMAKTQKATLDPSKISGRCGRLMCCLRYEDAGYEELRAKLPRRNSFVRTHAGVVGKVVEMQILTQLVRLQLPDGSQMVVANEEIVERNVPPPSLDTPQPAAETSSRQVKMATSPNGQGKTSEPDQGPAVEVLIEAPASESPESGEAVVQSQQERPSRGDSEQAARPPSGKRRKRRRRRKPSKAKGQDSSTPGQDGIAPGQPQAEASQHPGSTRKKRRRKRRKRKR